MTSSPNDAQPAEAHAVNASATVGMGTEADHGLANVNAETATALNRTVLQTLALAVAARIGVVRKPDETLEAFFIRLAGALEQKSRDQQGQIEARTTLARLKITIAELAPVLREPDGALAARLIARAEAPGAAPQKTAAVSVTNSYLQSGAAPARAAETLAMSQNMKAPSDAAGLFSNASLREDDQRQTPQMLQSQLRSLFAPDAQQAPQDIGAPGSSASSQSATQPDTAAGGVGEEPAGPVENDAHAASEPPLSGTDEAPGFLPSSDAPKGPSTLAASGGDASAAQSEELRTAISSGADVEAASRSDDGESLPRQVKAEQAPAATPEALRASVTPASVAALEKAVATAVMAERVLNVLFPDDDHLKTTLLVTGRSPLVESTLAEAILMFEAAGFADHESPEQSLMKLLSAPTEARAEAEAATEPDTAPPKQAPLTADAKSASPSSQEVMPKAPAQTSADPSARAAPTNLEPPAAQAAQAMQAHATVAFAYAAIPPAQERFESAEADEDKRDADEENEDSPAQDEDKEDPEARRERLAKGAMERLLAPEPEEESGVKITRDSSEADRAFALYQRMGGF